MGQYPFIKITPALAVGIIAGDYISACKYPCYLIWLSILIFILALLILSWKIRHFHRPNLMGIWALFCFVMIGFLLTLHTIITQRPRLSEEEIQHIDTYAATIKSRPVSTSEQTRYSIRMTDIRQGKKWVKVSWNALLYIKDAAPMRYGDQVLIMGTPSLQKHQKNPSAFDYATYLHRKGIYLRQFADKPHVHLFAHANGLSIKGWSIAAGDYFDDILKRYIHSSDELNLARAILIGRRDEISPEMEYVYQNTGTSHILAVSGLHVGIIYLMFAAIFSFLKKGRYTIIFYALLLLTLWFYAFMTGLSPPAVRATVMFSMLAVAQSIRRSYNIYNIIFFSAFIMLMYSPFLLFSVSFQLSYAAVTGIVYFYSRIYRKIYIQNRLGRFVWSVTALSLSAQLATFPITTYYFHQFPTLFFITNLAAIPIAIAALGGGIALIAFSFFPPMAHIIGWMMHLALYIYNLLMQLVNSFQFASIHGIYFLPAMVLLLYGIIWSLAKFTASHALFYFRIFTLMCCILSLWRIVEYYKLRRQSVLTIYAADQGTNIDYFVGEKAYSNMDDDDSFVRYQVMPNRHFHDIKEVLSFKKLPSARNILGNWLILRKGKSILIADNPKILTSLHLPVHISYLIIEQKKAPLLAQITKKLHPDQIIITGSSPWYSAKKMPSFPWNTEVIVVENRALKIGN